MGKRKRLHKEAVVTGKEKPFRASPDKKIAGVIGEAVDTPEDIFGALRLGIKGSSLGIKGSK